jgi:hypothetical protein
MQINYWSMAGVSRSYIWAFLTNILLKVQYFPSWDTPYMKYNVTQILTSMKNDVEGTEKDGDLPLVIEIFVSFRSTREDIQFLSLVEDHQVFPKNVCKNLLFFSWCNKNIALLGIKQYSLTHTLLPETPAIDQ